MRFAIPTGATVYLGKPAKPVQPKLVDSLRAVIAELPNILEAHLPQCWVKDILPEAGPILVLVLSGDSDGADDVALQMERRIAAILPPGSHLDFWLLAPNEPVLQAVRGAGCVVFAREPSP
jgi:hypothetical protein